MQLNFRGKVFYVPRTSTSKLFLTMKLTVLLVIIGCLQLGAKSFSQTITLSTNDASIEKVFSAIEKQSGYYFFYKYNDIRQAKPVSVSLKNASLKEALE